MDSSNFIINHGYQRHQFFNIKLRLIRLGSVIDHRQTTKPGKFRSREFLLPNLSWWRLFFNESDDVVNDVLDAKAGHNPTTVVKIAIVDDVGLPIDGSNKHGGGVLSVDVVTVLPNVQEVNVCVSLPMREVRWQRSH